MNKKLSVFLSAGLRSAGLRRRNGKIKRFIESEGFEVFLPQERLPLNKNFSDIEILETNIEGVKSSNIIVVVFDEAGNGVMFETGMADALDKIIVGVSFKKHFLSLELRGYWDSLRFKASNFLELRDIMRLIKKEIS